MVGKTFKGLTDEMLRWQSAHFVELATSRTRGTVFVAPTTVVEIAIDGVQRSSRYPGGVALRFARVKRYRDDKPAAEADTIDAVRAAFTAVFEQYPDAHWGHPRHFVTGDRGVSEWIFTGTTSDGKKVEVKGCDVFTFKGDKIAVKESYFNQLFAARLVVVNAHRGLGECLRRIKRPGQLLRRHGQEERCPRFSGDGNGRDIVDEALRPDHDQRIRDGGTQAGPDRCGIDAGTWHSTNTSVSLTSRVSTDANRSAPLASRHVTRPGTRTGRRSPMRGRRAVVGRLVVRMATASVTARMHVHATPRSVHRRAIAADSMSTMSTPCFE